MSSPAEIALVAARAGWRGLDLTVAVAVALAESRGNSNAHAVNSREDSRGLWQMNIKAHPEMASLNLYDPETNAKAAYGLWKSQGWGPWSAHNNNAYLLFMPVAQVAVQAALVKGVIENPGAAADALTGGAVSAAGDVAGAAREAAGALIKAGAWLGDRGNWVRIAQVTAGGVLMVSAVLVFVRPSPASLLPVGKIAGVAKKLT